MLIYHLFESSVMMMMGFFVSFADYSCALVGDILLQGFLYITENYFAFYSNVFGYVTKVSGYDELPKKMSAFVKHNVSNTCSIFGLLMNDLC